MHIVAYPCDFSSAAIVCSCSLSPIFAAGKMDLAAHVRGKPPRYSTARVAQWHEARKARLDAVAPVENGGKPLTR